jgi:hypothetical protein
MGRSTLFILVMVAAAGAAGGVAAHLLARTDPPIEAHADAPPPPQRSEGFRPSLEEWKALQLEVRGLREQLAEVTAKLSEASTRLEEVAAQEPLEGVRPQEAVAKLLESARDGSHVTALPGKVVSLSGSTPGVLKLGGLGKGAELLTLPEEEKWTRIREDLSLDAWQEDELKRLAEENRQAAEKMFLPEGGEEVDFPTAIGKLMEQRKKSTERVKNLLSDEQYEKFRDGGYGAAIGLGTTSVAVSYSSTAIPKDADGK